MFEFQIDSGSISNAGVGQVQSALVLVNTSATAGNGEFYGDGSATEVIRINASSMTVIAGVDNNSDACTWEPIAGAGRILPTNAMRSTNAVACGSTGAILAGAPKLQASFIAANNVTYYVHVEIYRRDNTSSPVQPIMSVT